MTDGRFGEIPTNLEFSAEEFLRRNSANDGWETVTGTSGG